MLIDALDAIVIVIVGDFRCGKLTELLFVSQLHRNSFVVRPVDTVPVDCGKNCTQRTTVLYLL